METDSRKQPEVSTQLKLDFLIFDFFTSPEKSPSPDSYQQNSLFNPNQTTSTFSNHMKKTTYCFGAGREHFVNTVVNPENLGADKGNPGPQEYTPLKPLGRDAL